MLRDFPWRKWIPILVWLSCIVMVVTLTIPWTESQRQSALRESNKNNLHQIGLGLLNYHDVWETLPPGGIYSNDGVPMHGWQTMMMSYMDACPLYYHIDSDYPWNDPVNEHLFRTENPRFSNPIIQTVATSDGFYLSHYSGNPAVFYRNSKVTLSDLAAGTSNVWVASDVFDDWQPWGSPFNWHDMDWPVRISKAEKGWKDRGVYVLMADARVVYYTGELDQSFIDDDLRQSFPQPDPALTAVPSIEWNYSRSGWRTIPDDFSAIVSDNEIAVTAQIKPTGDTRTIHVYDRYLRGTAVPTLSDVEFSIAEFPDTEILLADVVLDDEMLTVILKTQELEVLRVAEIKLSEEAMTRLAELKSLRILVGDCDEATADRLKTLLPDCELRLTIVTP